MDHAHAVISKTALWQCGVDLSLVANQKKVGDVFIVLKGSFCALNDDAASVVATHDIHCNSHKWTWTARRMALREPERQVPAVTVMTWRPL